MKKLAATLCLTALATAAFAQGTVNTLNGANTNFRTNSLATGGTSGNTANAATAPLGYLFEVLTAPSTITSVDSSLQALLSGPWSDTGLQLTNNAGIAGRVNAGSGVSVGSWQAGVSQSFIVVGWSASEGTTWASVAAKLSGATLTGTSGQQYWTGGSLVNGGFVGASTIQAGVAGGGSSGLPAFSLFGSAGGTQGTPITTASDLWVVNVPEPTSFALVGLGSAALMIFRRRK